MPWDQLLILVTGPAAIGMSQIERTKRWACMVGLAGQAGWFHATWIAEQWGMFAASFVYAGMWGIGLWRHWLSAIWSDFSYLDTATTSGASPIGGRLTPRKIRKKPSLQLVAKGVPPER